MTDGNGLHEITERLRAEEFPGVDKQLVQELLTAHVELQEDRAQARKITEQIVNRWSAGQGLTMGVDTGEDQDQ